MSMSIDLTEPISAGHHLAETVRRRTSDGVDAVRDVDLHVPVAAEAVIAAATHRARRARKHAKRAARDTRRSIETQVARRSRRVQRRAAQLTDQSQKPRVRVWIIGALLLGGAGAIAAFGLTKQRSQASTPSSAPAAADPTTSDANGSAPVADGARTATITR